MESSANWNCAPHSGSRSRSKKSARWSVTARKDRTGERNKAGDGTHGENRQGQAKYLHPCCTLFTLVCLRFAVFWLIAWVSGSAAVPTPTAALPSYFIATSVWVAQHTRV